MKSESKAILMVLGLCAFALARPVRAQEQEDFDPKKVVQQIGLDLEKIIKDMSQLTGSGDAGNGQRVVENIDKLLEQMQNSQGKVVSNIDELIKNLKMNPDGGGGGGGQQNSPPKSQGKGKQGSKSKSDRNQADGDEDRNQSGQKKKDGNKGGDKDGKKEESKGSEKPEDGTGDAQEAGGQNPKDPKQSKRGMKMKDRDPEKFQQDPIKDAWGFLPNETKQKLIEGNFKDYFPNYEKEIKEYMKSLNKK